MMHKKAGWNQTSVRITIGVRTVLQLRLKFGRRTGPYPSRRPGPILIQRWELELEFSERNFDSGEFECSNIRRRIGDSYLKYSNIDQIFEYLAHLSNPNRAFGTRIFEIPFTVGVGSHARQNWK